MSLATLKQAQDELKATTNAAGDALLLGYLNTLSRRVQSKGFNFEPFKKTEYLPLRADLVRSDLRLYKLPYWAVGLDAVTVYNTALTVTTTVKPWPVATQAFHHLQLVSTDGDWYNTYADSSYDPLVVVTADWAYHPELSNAWHAEDTVQNLAPGISASAISVTVVDADGANWKGETPRFSAGQLLKIGTEFIRVAAVNTTTNILTIQRGVNGSTAAIHANASAISVWYPADDIVRLCARGAALMYAKRGAFEQPGNLDAGAAYPTDWLSEMYGILQEYQNL